MKRRLHRAALPALFLLALLPPGAFADADYSSINKSIRVESGASAGDVDSVNGAIRIGSGAAVRSVDSVNGAISLDRDVTVEKDVEAVNGAIELAAGGQVGGSVSTVNGGIRVSDSRVAADVTTVNGTLRLLDGTAVEGDVRVRKPWGWGGGRDKPVRVEIGEGVRVSGDLIFERPVELRMHDSASVGGIVGDEVTRVDG